MTQRSTHDITARADHFADAFKVYEPQPGDLNAELPRVLAARLATWRGDGARA
jgi:hypothetical protein